MTRSTYRPDARRLQSARGYLDSIGTLTKEGDGQGARSAEGPLIAGRPGDRPDGSTFAADGTGAAGSDFVVTDDNGAFALSDRLSGTVAGWWHL